MAVGLGAIFAAPAVSSAGLAPWHLKLLLASPPTQRCVSGAVMRSLRASPPCHCTCRRVYPSPPWPFPLQLTECGLNTERLNCAHVPAHPPMQCTAIRMDTHLQKHGCRLCRRCISPVSPLVPQLYFSMLIESMLPYWLTVVRVSVAKLWQT